MEAGGERPVVVVAGGGIAGIEATLALRDLARERAEVKVVSPDLDFVLKPFVVEEPFNLKPAESHELGPMLERLGATCVRDALRRVVPGARQIELGDGSMLPYDYLVVCVGGRVRPAFEGVETFWSTSGDLPIDELIERAGYSRARTMALIVPPGTSWPLPLYELALLIRRRAEERGIYALRIELLTPEEGPLFVFGPLASGALAELLEARQIEVRANTHVVQAEDGSLSLVPAHEPLEAEVVLALPVINGPAVAGLPCDEHGFIPIDGFGRVAGVENVYAAGDGTNFPVKQGGLATQQADAAAEHIAARLGAEIEPKAFQPVLRGQLITGAESRHMRQDLRGGEGEGLASLDYLWWPPHKVSGRYLSAFLGHTTPRDLEPELRPIEVEIALPHEWHGELGSFDSEPL